MNCYIANRILIFLFFVVSLFYNDVFASILQISTINGIKYSYQVAISPDGDYVVVGDEDQNIVTFAKSTGKILWTYALPDPVESASISNNGSLVVIGVQKNYVVCIAKNGTLIWQNEVNGEVPIAMTDTGNKIYAFDNYLDKLICFQNDGSILWEKLINTSGWTVWKISVSSNGDTIMLKTNSDIIICDDLGSFYKFYDVIEGNYLADSSLSPDGTKCVVSYADGNSKKVALIDLRLGTLWTKTVEPYSPGVEIDNQYNVYATVTDYDNYLWDVNGTLIRTWPNGGSNIEIDNEGYRCIIGAFSEARVYEMFNKPDILWDADDNNKWSLPDIIYGLQVLSIK